MDWNRQDFSRKEEERVFETLNQELFTLQDFIAGLRVSQNTVS